MSDFSISEVNRYIKTTQYPFDVPNGLVAHGSRGNNGVAYHEVKQEKVSVSQ